MRIFQDNKKVSIKRITYSGLAWITLAYVDIRLKLFPCGKKFTLLKSRSDIPIRRKLSYKSNIEQILNKWEDAVMRASRYPLGLTMNCIRRAIALRIILRMYGIKTELCYGISHVSVKEHPGHAWLVVLHEGPCKGRLLGANSNLEQYTLLQGDKVDNGKQ